MDAIANQSDIQPQLLTIGGKERIYLPDVRKAPFVARVDTGAKTSALHCFSAHVEKMKRKEVLCVQFSKNSRMVVRFPKFSRRSVRSSNGHVQQRFSVMLTVVFGDQKYRTPFTLTNRSDMNFAALLGRRFLRNRFQVDVSKSYTVKTSKKLIE
ncbi:MAG: hypothetical protein EA392_10345 [Cryomorphaceae bacterium]|nr:MAG: hypothetical protein EA392_10345 [Cryomorphaceae bacterium]